MDLRVLRYFLTVAREGNISSAASRLGVTQPTLSRQLQELESEFHIKLFNRGCRGRTLTLTEKGAILRHRAEEILLLSEKTACELKSEECISGNVYIGVSAGAGAALEAVGRAAAQIKAEHVHTEIVIRKNGCCALYDAVDKGTCDFVLVPEFIDMWDLQCECARHKEPGRTRLLCHDRLAVSCRKTLQCRGTFGFLYIKRRG